MKDYYTMQDKCWFSTVLSSKHKKWLKVVCTYVVIAVVFVWNLI